MCEPSEIEESRDITGSREVFQLIGAEMCYPSEIEELRDILTGSGVKRETSTDSGHSNEPVSRSMIIESEGLFI